MIKVFRALFVKKNAKREKEEAEKTATDADSAETAIGAQVRARDVLGARETRLLRQ